jgi:hypothetical protein
MSEEALHPKQVIVLEAGYIYKRPTDNEYHQGLELDTNSKGVQPYVTSRFLKVQSPRS